MLRRIVFIFGTDRKMGILKNWSSHRSEFFLPHIMVKMECSLAEQVRLLDIFYNFIVKNIANKNSEKHSSISGTIRGYELFLRENHKKMYKKTHEILPFFPIFWNDCINYSEKKCSKFFVNLQKLSWRNLVTKIHPPHQKVLFFMKFYVFSTWKREISLERMCKRDHLVEGEMSVRSRSQTTDANKLRIYLIWASTGLPRLSAGGKIVDSKFFDSKFYRSKKSPLK